MTQKLITIYGCKGPLCESVPQDVVLCLPFEKVAPHVCPISLGDSPFQFSVIDGSLVYQCATGGQWQFDISYDDSQLIPNYTLKGGDILGVECKGCVGKYADERAGNEVYIYTNDDGFQVLVSQHGCEYVIRNTNT